MLPEARTAPAARMREDTMIGFLDFSVLMTVDYFIIVYVINILIDCSFLKPLEVDLDLEEREKILCTILAPMKSLLNC